MWIVVAIVTGQHRVSTFTGFHVGVCFLLWLFVDWLVGYFLLFVFFVLYLLVLGLVFVVNPGSPSWVDRFIAWCVPHRHASCMAGVEKRASNEFYNLMLTLVRLALRDYLNGVATFALTKWIFTLTSLGCISFTCFYSKLAQQKIPTTFHGPKSRCTAQHNAKGGVPCNPVSISECAAHRHRLF